MGVRPAQREALRPHGLRPSGPRPRTQLGIPPPRREPQARAGRRDQPAQDAQAAQLTCGSRLAGVTDLRQGLGRGDTGRRAVVADWREEAQAEATPDDV